MSLNAAAQHLAAHGRGPDTTLVHMSHGEVKGLQDLARSYGGSLSINPHTGLPEAGFLSSILPMIGGAALSAMGMPPMVASLVMGGVTGMATGSMQKGLMAGLGAYGGSGLMGGLMGAGSDAAAGALGAENAATAANMGEYANARDVLMARNAAPAMEIASSPTQSAMAGLKGLGTEEGRTSFMNNIGGNKELLKYGAMAAAPLAANMLEPTTPQPSTQTGDKDQGQKYKYSPGRVSLTPAPDPLGREQRYFNPVYTPIGASDARSIYGYAGGGTIENMSNANAIGANTGYPMADINKGAYATPWQTPVSRNVLSDAADTGVSPINGEMSFADGGSTATPMPDTYSYDPETQAYKKNETLQVKLPPAPVVSQGVGVGMSAPMSDSAFAAQQAQGAKNAESLGNLGSTVTSGLLGFLSQPPMAVQIAQSILGAMGMGTSSQAAHSPNALGFNQGKDSEAANSYSPSSSSGLGVNAGNDGSVGGEGSGSSAAFGGGFGSGGDARGGYLANGKFDQRPMAAGGISSHLGDYSDGGRLLRGPGDGVSDSIPAQIGHKQPARLADGEFVVPARIVSELGNGSTEAGARKLYAMMDRVQKARGQTVGKGKIAKNSRADRYLPA